MNKENVVYTYNSTQLKKMRILSFATNHEPDEPPWMNLEDIMLSKISHAQKDK